MGGEGKITRASRAQVNHFIPRPEQITLYDTDRKDENNAGLLYGFTVQRSSALDVTNATKGSNCLFEIWLYIPFKRYFKCYHAVKNG